MKKTNLPKKPNIKFTRKEYLNTSFSYEKKDIASLYNCILFNTLSFVFACLLILIFAAGLVDKIVSFLGESFYTVIIMFAPLVCVALLGDVNTTEYVLAIKKWTVIKKILKNPFFKKSKKILKNRTKLLQKLNQNMDFECYKIQMGIMGEFTEKTSFQNAIELLNYKDNYCHIEYKPSKIVLTINEYGWMDCYD